MRQYLDLARRQGLTAYDASYLGLCLVRGASLASRDGDLIAACTRNGVPVEDLR